MSPEQKARSIELAYAGATQSSIARELGLSVKAIKDAAAIDLIYQGNYARALDTGLDSLVDQLLDLCDTEENMALLRQKSDNIKWVAGKRGHQRYGDRLEVNVNQQVDIGGALIEARKRSHLLPAGNHVALADVQDTEYTELITLESTGSKPVAAEPGEDPDIFA